MKKKILLFTAITLLLSGCSSDDTTSSNNYDFGTIHFTLEGYHSFSNSDDIGCEFITYINNNGTKTYTISSLIERVGNNPIFEQDLILFDFEFTQVGDIQVGQTIAINNMDNFTFLLPYNNNNSSYLINCNQIELVKQSSSSGQIIITQIDNDFVYGDFEFNNLNNGGGVDYNGNHPCSNYPSQQNFNIINGTFKAQK